MQELEPPVNVLAKVHLRRAFNVPKADMNSESDPYVRVLFKGYSVPIRNATKRVDDDANPVWDQTLFFLITDLTELAMIQIYDYDELSADDFVASCEVEKAKWDGAIRKYTMEAHKGHDHTENLVTIEMSIETVRFDNLGDMYAIREERRQQLLVAEMATHRPMFLVYVHIHGAEDLLPLQDMNSMDPYAAIEFDPPKDHSLFHPKEMQTSVQSQTLSPVWDKGVFLLLRNINSLSVVIRDRDETSRWDNVAEATIEIGFFGRRKIQLQPQGALDITLVALPCRGLFSDQVPTRD